jgi:hypothetical protein
MIVTLAWYVAYTHMHCRHCPEFTLTYPDYDPTNKWEDAMLRVDEEVRQGGACVNTVTTHETHLTLVSTLLSHTASGTPACLR